MGRGLRLTAALAISLLVPMPVAGCSRYFPCAPRPSEDISMADLEGVYTGSGGGRIELTGDGHYTASNLSPEVPGEAEEGMWTLDLDSPTTEDVRLGDHQMWISGDGGESWLYRFEGDPDSCDLIEFHRER
ncbi:hypothetical protein ACLQ25_03360 [Micromonospora sp. DT44]|uniref:hypothetical protein n=1 Tax=Micromonospora sp. DT44 TaxID=3393439 RepID=UPI003CE6F293